MPVRSHLTSSDFFTADCKDFFDNEEYIGLTKTSKSIADNKVTCATVMSSQVKGRGSLQNEETRFGTYTTKRSPPDALDRWLE